MNEKTDDTLECNETCARCGVVGADRRTIWMACFYAMNVLGVPFEQVSVHGVVLQPNGDFSRFGTPEFGSPSL